MFIYEKLIYICIGIIKQLLKMCQQKVKLSKKVSLNKFRKNYITKK